ncbi:putative pectinesterase/pectinesterase inhibitor 26 [Abeliophyllum distichum]|uniref:pectinesterase n=1 Tax=Abeliophyllum distichum TaxID=126358 RepID=A0ABD1RXM0_9LAMI
MDQLNTSSKSSTKTSLLEKENFSSIQRRNKRLIISFFSLIILLALIIGAIITSLIHKHNIKLQSIHPNLAIQQFCSAIPTESTCITSLSSTITPTSEADPNQIFVNILEISIAEVFNITSMMLAIRSNHTRTESAFQNCSTLLRDSLSQLHGTLGIMHHNPDLLTQTYGQRRDMMVWITTVIEDLRSCLDDLGKVKSTVVDEVSGEIHGLEVYMSYSRDFLHNCDSVLENFGFALQMKNSENSSAVIHESITEPPESEEEPSQIASNSAQSLKTVCAVTRYPKSCFSSISSLNPPSTANPLNFFNLSLQATARELSNLTSLPKELISKSNDKRTESALKDCISLFDDSVSQLSRSLELMKVGTGEKVLTDMNNSDLQTWISAAMTDQETCLDGIGEMGSTVPDEFRVKVQKSQEYMSNTLAILNNIQSLFEKFGLTMP